MKNKITIKTSGIKKNISILNLEISSKNIMLHNDRGCIFYGNSHQLNLPWLEVKLSRGVRRGEKTFCIISETKYRIQTGFLWKSRYDSPFFVFLIAWYHSRKKQMSKRYPKNTERTDSIVISTYDLQDTHDLKNNIFHFWLIRSIKKKIKNKEIQ